MMVVHGKPKKLKTSENEPTRLSDNHDDIDHTSHALPLSGHDKDPFMSQESSSSSTKVETMVKKWYSDGYKGEHGPQESPYFEVFRSLKSKFPELESCLYPGSYIHVVPALAFPVLVMVDSFKGKGNHVVKFFSESYRQELVDFLSPWTVHDKQPTITFHNSDYLKPDVLKKLESQGPFDVVVSFSAPGRISETFAPMVRKDGFLVANDDFGDASLARASTSTWDFIGAWTSSSGRTGNHRNNKKKRKVTEVDKSDQPNQAESDHLQVKFITDPDDLQRTFFIAAKTKKPLADDQYALNSGLAFSKRPHKFTQNAMAYLFRKK